MIVEHDEAFQILWFQFLEKNMFQCKQMVLVPPVATLFAKSPILDKYDLSSVEHVNSGAAPLGQGVEDTLAERLKPTFISVRQGLFP